MILFHYNDTRLAAARHYDKLFSKLLLAADSIVAVLVSDSHIEGNTGFLFNLFTKRLRLHLLVDLSSEYFLHFEIRSSMFEI